MSPQREWTKLREWNGSRGAAFEELCCQIAAAEDVPPGSKFNRKGTPDGGLECYWTLPKGDEWGWQAKFFGSTPGRSQWQQISKSVTTAIKTHPRLRRYFVCLPLDRADPRKPGKSSFKDQWDQHVKKWKAWENAHPSLEFEYWGTSELFNRLSLDKHAGRNYFWFNAEFLHGEWFKQHITATLQDAGTRYSQATNVPLPLLYHFESLGRTDSFLDQFDHLRREVHRKLKHCTNLPESLRAGDVATALERVQGLFEFSHTDLLFSTKIPFAGFLEDLHCVRTIVTQRLDDIIVQRHVQESASERRRAYTASPETYQLEQLLRAIDSLIEFLHENHCSLSNAPAMLLTGDAGVGKTHVFCDVALSSPLKKSLTRRVEWSRWSEVGLSGRTSDGDGTG